MDTKTMKKSSFIRYLREQAEALEEFAEAIEDGEDPEDIPHVLYIKPETYLTWENGFIKLVEG